MDHYLAVLVDDLEAQQGIAAIPVDLDETEVVTAVQDRDPVPIALRHPEHVLGPVEGTRSEVVGRVARLAVHHRELGEVAVAADEDRACRAPEEREKPLAFQREVRPRFTVRVLIHHLDARPDDADLGGNAQLLFQPVPLFHAENRGTGVGDPQVTAAIHAVSLVVLPHQGRTVVAGVEEDDLHSPPGRAHDLGVVHAVARAPRRVLGHLEEVQEDLPGGLLERVLGARVVLAIVVVVPRGEDPRGFLQRLIAGLRPELGVGGAQLHRVGGIRVHIVAQEHESVGFQGQHVLPDWLHSILAQAGTESDAAHGRFIGRGHGGQ